MPKITSFPSETFLHPPLTLSLTLPSVLHSTTSIVNPNLWVFHGNSVKTLPSCSSLYTSACCGTSAGSQSRYHRQRRQNTWGRSQTGARGRRTPFLTYSNFTANSYMHAWSSQQDMLISPRWKPCSESVLVILLCLITLSNTWRPTLTGGASSSPHLSSAEASYVPPLSMTSMASQTQAHPSVLQLLSMGIGRPGPSVQTGRPAMDNVTSAGPNALALSFSSSPSWITSPLTKNGTSICSATTKVSSMPGTMAVVATGRSISYSAGYMTDLNNSKAASPSTSAMSRVAITQLTVPLEGSTRQAGFFSPPSPYHQSSPPSSQRKICTVTPLQGALSSQALVSTPWLKTHQSGIGGENSSNTMTAGGVSSSRFTTAVSLSPPANSDAPHAYHHSLTLRTCTLRPHCLAWDRLHLWTPLNSQSCLDHAGSTVALSDCDIDHIFAVLAHSHTISTCECYGSGLLVFHIFCDSCDIPEGQRCPASSILLLAFIANCTGLYSSRTLENYLYGIRAWHLLHGLPWLTDQTQITLALEGAKCLAPPQSSHLKRSPFTIDLLVEIRSALNLSTPLHAAVYACLTTSFFAIARTGEFTVNSLSCFDPLQHVKCMDMRHKTDHNSFEVITFQLPRTKTAFDGESVYWAAQSGPADPQVALTNHLAIHSVIQLAPSHRNESTHQVRLPQVFAGHWEKLRPD